MKATEKQIKAAAKELNALGFEPPLNIKGNADDILLWLTNAIKLLEKDDVLSEETQEVVDELKAEGKKAAKTEKLAPAPKAKKETPKVPEKEDEDEDEKEEEKPTPAPKGKKEAPKAPEKPAETKETPKAETKKSVSPTYLVRYAVCENPNITIEELQKVLKKAGADMAPISITLRKNEMVAAIAILKEQGQLKK